MRVQFADGAQRDFDEGLGWYRKRRDWSADGFDSYAIGPAKFIPLIGGLS